MAVKDGARKPVGYQAPWEAAFTRVISPLEEFIHRQTTSSILLMIFAVIAIGLANSPLGDAYIQIIHKKLAVSFGDWQFQMSLQHWINDGLMAIFFFVVGLEIKRELLVGELADLRRAALPIIAAIGGMLVPALVYYFINRGGPGSSGWGIAMATDIAFALGALALLGNRVPKKMIIFLVALAIIDDLGAVTVIALFYTAKLHYDVLVGAGLCFLVLIALNLGGVRRVLPYTLTGIAMWICLLASGIHATVAGIFTALTIPARPKYDPVLLSAHLHDLLGRFESSYQPGESVLTNDTLRSLAQTMESGLARVQAPLQRLEHGLHLYVAYLVMPAFALANAGFALDFSDPADALGNPVTVGIIMGLVVGKFVGIFGAAWLAVRLGLAKLPEELRMAHIGAVALLAGIGFTMSIFVAELAFGDDLGLLLQAKTGIVLASLFAGLSGYLWVWWLTRDNTAEGGPAQPE